MLLALLQMPEVEIGQFAAPQSTPEQNREDRPNPFTLERVQVWRLQQSTRLVHREPVPKPYAQLLHAFDASNACGELRAEQPGIGGLVCKPPYGRQPSIDCACGELTIFEKDAVAGHHNLVER
jgi:hypothetical protein